MNNEPVAWMMKAREPSLHCPDYVTFEKPTRDMKISHHPYPLYTHPANTCKHGVDDGACKECYQEATHPANPIKPLTAEEEQMILSIWEKLQPHLFVKAQEK